MRIATTLAVVILTVAGSEFLSGQISTTQESIIARLLETTTARDYSTIESFLQSSWSSDSAARKSLPSTLWRIQFWGWMSRGLAIRDIVRGEEETVAVLVENRLTEEIDSLHVEFDGALSIRKIDLRTGVSPTHAEREMATDSARVYALSRYLQKLVAADVFSGVVIVARNHDPLFYESFGSYDHAGKRYHLKRDTPFNTASLGKIFTATAIMRLVEKQSLTLEDSLGAVLLDNKLGKQAQSIRIKHLLSHTSGIIPGRDTLQFDPGTGWSYSSYGYNILGEVIEAVSGQHWHDYLSDHLFTPAGLTRTNRYELEKPVSEIATGYVVREFSPDGPVLEANDRLQIWAGTAAGGLYSTASDLLNFAEAIRKGRLISQASLATMREPKPQLGAPRYGFGVMLWRGYGIWGHAGDLPGTDADLEIFGDSGYTSIVLSNYGGVNDPIRRKIAHLWSGEFVSD